MSDPGDNRKSAKDLFPEEFEMNKNPNLH